MDLAESGISRWTFMEGRGAEKNSPLNEDLSIGTTRWIVPLTFEWGIIFFILPFLLILVAKET